MAVLNVFKGKITLKEITELPNRIFHELYHRHYLIATNKDKNGAQEVQNNETMDQLEEAAEKGMF